MRAKCFLNWRMTVFVKNPFDIYSYGTVLSCKLSYSKLPFDIFIASISRKHTTIQFSTHCGLVAPHGDLNLLQAIAWTNIRFSIVNFCGIPHDNNFAISVQAAILHNAVWKLYFLKTLPHLTEANELILYKSYTTLPHIQCGAVITRSFFHKVLTNDTP